MSRSLRTRPMTLYAQDGQPPVIPPVPILESQHQAQQTTSTSTSRYGAYASTSSAPIQQRHRDKVKKKASEVGSNLKKRLSMRYAEPTTLTPGGFSAIPSIPSLPPMPEIFIENTPHQFLEHAQPSAGIAEEEEVGEAEIRKSSDTTRSRTELFSSDPAVDLTLLSATDFDPQAYLRAKLGSSSAGETALRDFKNTLAAAKQAANDDLKKQVFRNYSEFI